MCINCGLGRFLKPIVKSNFGWQHGHICAQHFSFLIFQNCSNLCVEVTWWHRDLGKSWIAIWCTTILYGHQMQPQTFCKPKVKQKISHNCVGISSFHSIAMYSKMDGVAWWIVMVIWWTRYWTRNIEFFLLICDLVWVYMLYILGVIYCIHIDSRDVGLIYNLLPEQPFGKHEFGGQYSKSHWNTILVKIVWII